jgi:hypothetical protein
MKRKVGQFQPQTAEGCLFTIYEYHDVGSASAPEDRYEPSLEPPKLGRPKNGPSPAPARACTTFCPWG